MVHGERAHAGGVPVKKKPVGAVGQAPVEVDVEVVVEVDVIVDVDVVLDVVVDVEVV